MWYKWQQKLLLSDKLAYKSPDLCYGYALHSSYIQSFVFISTPVPSTSILLSVLLLYVPTCLLRPCSVCLCSCVYDIVCVFAFFVGWFVSYAKSSARNPSHYITIYTVLGYSPWLGGGQPVSSLNALDPFWHLAYATVTIQDSLEHNVNALSRGKHSGVFVTEKIKYILYIICINTCIYL